MNFRLVAKYLGIISAALGGTMVFSAAWAVYFREWDALGALCGAMAVSCAFGAVLYFVGRTGSQEFYLREALALVGFSWLTTAGLGALPFVFAGELGPIDAYFESMSGFTTTGSTVIVDIEACDNSILFWRSFTHWLGGMGIVVLFIAVLPYLGAGGKLLFRSESPGPDPRGLKPRIKDTASILWKIYLGFTILQTVVLMLAGLNLFDSLCQTFGTLGTGGYSNKQASIAAFHSIPVEMIIVFFIVCAGTNFGLYFQVLRKDWFAVFRDTEWRAYITILAIATILIAVNLMIVGVVPASEGAPMIKYSLGNALRFASFHVASIMTSTGFGTDDFDRWPAFSRMLLVVLMFVGGCAGSTTGGIKVIRLVLLAKMIYWRLEYTFRPKTVRALRVGGEVVNQDVQSMIYAFFVVYVVWFAFGAVFMSALGLPFQTAVTSVAATLNTVGPGLELVGPVRDFHLVPAVGKLFLSLCMVMGRLEMFTLCAFFVPAFWRHR